MRRSWGGGDRRRYEPFAMSFLNAPSSPPLSAFPSVTRMHETNKQPMIQQINILKQPRSFIIHLRRISQSTRVDFGEKKKSTRYANPAIKPISGDATWRHARAARVTAQVLLLSSLSSLSSHHHDRLLVTHSHHTESLSSHCHAP